MSQPSTSSSSSVQEQAGAGSVWNPGNWHWESKNFNKIAEDSVRSRLLSIVVDDNRYVVRIIDVTKLKAEASIVIRKGKKVPIFDISFTAKWEGKSILGADKVITGEAIVADLMPDDIDDDFPVRLQLSNGSSLSSSVSSVSSVNSIDTSVKSLVTTLLGQQIRNHMREFVSQISTLDGGPEALIADSVRRATERIKYEEALVTKAEEKQKIANDQAKLEKQRKDEELAKHNKLKQQQQQQQQLEQQQQQRQMTDTNKGSATGTTPPPQPSSSLSSSSSSSSSSHPPSSSPSSSAASTTTSTTEKLPKASSSFASNLRSSFLSSGNTPKSPSTVSSVVPPETQSQAVEHVVNLEGKAVPAGEIPDAKASAWNTGGWQWEEKEFTPWAKTRLIELLVGIDIDIPGGHVKIMEVSEVKGDATVALRKGKKIVIFDLSINAKWEGSLMDDEGNPAGTGDGEIIITELDQDTENFNQIPLEIKACDDGGVKDKQLSKLLNKWGMVTIKKKIWQFVEELKAKE